MYQKGYNKSRMDHLDQIRKNAERLLREIPVDVTLLAAAKTRTIDEVRAAYKAGVRHFGHNYVQEARDMLEGVDFQAQWHMIGHLQRNKVKDAVALFDIVESLDSLRLASELDKRCAETGRTMEVLIEINSGAEEDKSGILPGELDALIGEISKLEHIKVVGLMTMGPLTGAAELARPYFVRTRVLFEKQKVRQMPNIDMKVLSMGMSASYLVAIQEGATMVRIGTLLFGPRS